jgi:Rps23 Pro-64 3,4-dihydroxylase Tpa1-like proline 4-hydroxylase
VPGPDDVTFGLSPRFNALHLFKVPQRHSVSLVAPFAGAPRLSITGWLRR